MRRTTITPLLSITSNILLPLLIIFSIYLLIRGHNEPGGGFVGGLVAASSFTLFAIANGVETAREKLKVNPRTLILAGITTMFSSAIFPLLLGKAFMKSFWFERQLPVIGKVGTPLIFDLGVYLLVTGVALMIIFSFAEEE